MAKLLQINSAANWGSTGKIAEQIGDCAIKHGWDSYIAYGRIAGKSNSKLIKIGSKLGVLWHGVESRLFDNHGLASRHATKCFIKQIEQIKPDIIHLHNIHGYYLNYEILFNYLQKSNIQVVWTLHDCWPFTGHCAHYIYTNCRQWQSACRTCRYHKAYPLSFISRVARNFKLKKRSFTSLGERLTIIPVSKWLASQVEQSLLFNSRIMHIYNGVDIDIFTSMPSFEIRKQLGITARYMLLGVATAWSDRKGLSDYYKLRELLSDEYVIVLVGLTAAQISTLPKGIVGIQRTHTQKELSELYSTADVVLSLSQAETFGLTVAEGMACGTPAVVYNASALPELITPQTGIVVDKVGDVAGVANAIRTLCHNEKSSYSAACRKHIEEQFDKNKCFQKYITLYDEILTKSKF